MLERLYPQAGTVETYLNNAGTADIGYDGMQRTIEMRDLRSDNSMIVGFTYTYDRMGNELTQGEPYDPVNNETLHLRLGVPPAHVQPGRGRPGAVAEQLEAGRRGQLARRSTASRRQFSSTNELVQTAAAAGGPATVTYDNNGNETDDGTYLYTYDALNRLVSVTLKSNGELIASYSYDALGRRIQKVVTNSGSLDGTTDYDYDGQQDIEEHDGAGTLTQQYVYGAGINEVLVMDRNLTGGPTATAPGDQRLFY